MCPKKHIFRCFNTFVRERLALSSFNTFAADISQQTTNVYETFLFGLSEKRYSQNIL